MALDITVVHVSTPAELRYLMRRGPVLDYRLMVAFGAAALGVGAAFTALGTAGDSGLLFGAALLLLATLGPWLASRRIPRHLAAPRSVHLTDEHIRVTGELTTTQFRWAAITRVRRDRGRWLFYIGDVISVVFLDATLTPDRAEELTRFLAARGLDVTAGRA